ncbi:MAG TPA: glycosyltransferase family 2 protein [Gemmataceae bacterium]|nr:glycosyltransferase family 2 protein [Gemmataceae bacterium]
MSTLPLKARNEPEASATGPQPSRTLPARCGSRIADFEFDVSVCIVNWNCREHLQACLQSLRERAAEVSLEVLVVDNGSSDGAADMVAEQFPEVILIRNAENTGFARANNQAAGLARGHYLFFLNNDTVVPPGTLNGLFDYAQAHPEAGIIGPRLRDERGRPQLSCRTRPTLAALLNRITWLRWFRLFRREYRRYRGREADAGSAPRPVEILMGAALFVPHAVFRACGAWDEEYTFGGEDIDLCVRIGRRYRVIYHPGLEIVHFGRVSSRQHVGFSYAHTVIGVTRSLRKHGCSPAGLLFYKLALTLDVPLRWFGHAVRYASRRLRGQPNRAAKSRMVMRGLEHFLMHGLPELWRV